MAPTRSVERRASDKLRGGGGDDKLKGGGGDDTLRGGAGIDRLNCGPGDDVAFADSNDIVSNLCETVRRPLQGRAARGGPATGAGASRWPASSTGSRSA